MVRMFTLMPATITHVITDGLYFIVRICTYTWLQIDMLDDGSHIPFDYNNSNSSGSRMHDFQRSAVALLESAKDGLSKEPYSRAV